jgi:hypothetical protein
LKSTPIDRCWKIILEGALFEGRVGNVKSCRGALSFLMKKCSSYGPVYHEASKFEERIGNHSQSKKICEEGLYYNEKYSPLWF